MRFRNLFLQNKTVNTRRLPNKNKGNFYRFKRKELGINFRIWKVYDYADKTGKYYLVLTEDGDAKDAGKHPSNTAIKAFNFKIDGKVWTKTFETNDTKHPEELSIWFWTRYVYVEDFDNDGIIEPILFMELTAITVMMTEELKF